MKAFLEALSKDGAVVAAAIFICLAAVAGIVAILTAWVFTGAPL